MGADYGSDFSCESDIDAGLTVVSGLVCLGQALVRRLQTPRGGLFYDLEYGTDLREFVNGHASARDIERAAERELLKDERVEQVRASCSFDGERAVVRLSVLGAAGPFSLVVGVSSLTVEMLELREAA